jgi:hypothetical protein
MAIMRRYSGADMALASCSQHLGVQSHLSKAEEQNPIADNAAGRRIRIDMKYGLRSFSGKHLHNAHIIDLTRNAIVRRRELQEARSPYLLNQLAERGSVADIELCVQRPQLIISRTTRFSNHADLHNEPSFHATRFTAQPARSVL